jgi:hypothetical protein
MLKRMIAPLLALLVSTLPSVAGSQAVTSKHRAPVPPTADLLSETFNNVTNYDDGTGADAWTEVTESGGEIDPNETALCPAGTGFGSTECFQTVATVANQKGYVRNELAALQSGLVYSVHYIYLTGMAAWSDAQEQMILAATTTTSYPSVFSAQWVATLIYDGDGVTSGQTSCAAACWRLKVRIGGVEAAAYPEIAVDTIYKVKFRVDNASAVGEAILGSTTLLSSTDSAADVRYIWVGQVDPSRAAGTILFDNVKLSTGGYVE